MRIPQKGNGTPRGKGYHQRIRNGRQKGHRSTGMETTEERQRNQIIPWVLQLLSKIHQEFLPHSKTTAWSGVEERPMEVDGKQTEGFWDPQEGRNREASFEPCWSRPAVQDGNGCLKLSLWSCTITETTRRTMTPGSIHVEVHDSTRTKLWYRRQGGFRDHQAPSTLETLARSHEGTGRNSDRSQESGQFLKPTNTQPETEKMARSPSKIQLRNQISPREKKLSSGCPL